MSNVYLICSNSYRMMEEEIKKIVLNNKYTSFDLNSVELDEVLEEAAYFSLFDEKKYMVVKNATIFAASKRKNKEDDNNGEEETISKKDEKLLKYLEEPNNNTILMFCLNGKADSKKKICKFIHTIEFYPHIHSFKLFKIYFFSFNPIC